VSSRPSGSPASPDSIHDPDVVASAAEAISQIDAWLESPSVVLLSEGATYWSLLSSLLASAKVTGPLVHDARIAALCLPTASGNCGVRIVISAASPS
jgi:uncharacterized protein